MDILQALSNLDTMNARHRELLSSVQAFNILHRIDAYLSFCAVFVDQRGDPSVCGPASSHASFLGCFDDQVLALSCDVLKDDDTRPLEHSLGSVHLVSDVVAGEFHYDGSRACLRRRSRSRSNSVRSVDVYRLYVDIELVVDEVDYELVGVLAGMFWDSEKSETISPRVLLLLFDVALRLFQVLLEPVDLLFESFLLLLEVFEVH